MEEPIKIKCGEMYYLKKLLTENKIKTIMTKNVVSIDVDAHFREVPRKLIQHRIRHLPVVDKYFKVIGLITQRDLYKIIPPHKLEDGVWAYDEDTLEGIVLAQVMTPNPFTMSPENTVAEALLKMVATKYGCIPIVDKDTHLVGILTQIDILRLAAEVLKP